MWSTTYIHTLSGEDAVYRFIKETFDGQQALKESGGGVSSAQQVAEFEQLYRSKLAKAYPPNRSGVTLFPFTRFFLVARRVSVLEAEVAHARDERGMSMS